MQPPTDQAPQNPTEAHEQGEQINKSVMKATMILGQLGRSPQGMTVTEVANAARLSRPTASRLLLTLEHADFVDRHDGRYKLGWQLARLGRLADPYESAVHRVQPILDSYAAQLDESLSFAMMRSDLEFEVIAEASGSRMLSVTHRYVGGVYPLHASASGKIALAEVDDSRILDALPEHLDLFTPKTIGTRTALLADVQKVRDQGYAVLDEELEEGLFSIGLPVREESGGLIGILTINGPSQRLNSEALPSTIDTGLRIAAAIAAAL